MIKNIDNKFKILVLVCDLEKGGVQRTAQNFADGFNNLGHKVRLHASNSGGIREKNLKLLGIKYWIGFNSEILEKIANWEPEIVLLQDCGITYFHIKTLKNILPKAIFIEQNTFSKPSKWENFLNHSFQMTCWGAWKYFRKSNKKSKIVDILPYPIKTSSFYPAKKIEINKFKNNLNIPSENIVIGRVGQANKGKWSNILINSFEKIVEEKTKFKFTLLLVNPPSNIVNQAKSSKTKDKIVIIKRINKDEELRVAYSAMDIFALAAEQGESFGHVLAESMLCKIPVVALSTPWFDNSQCEVVGHMRGGLICLSPTGFKNGLLRLIEDKNLRIYLGKIAREKILNSYDYLDVCSNLLDKILNPIKLNKINIKRKIISIYSNSFDLPKPFTLFLINLSFGLTLTRFTTGYQSLTSYLIRNLFIFFNKFSQKRKD